MDTQVNTNDLLLTIGKLTVNNELLQKQLQQVIELYNNLKKDHDELLNRDEE